MESLVLVESLENATFKLNIDSPFENAQKFCRLKTMLHEVFKTVLNLERCFAKQLYLNGTGVVVDDGVGKRVEVVVAFVVVVVLKENGCSH